MGKAELKRLLAELHHEFWVEEEKKHGVSYNELSFGADAFLRWLSKPNADDERSESQSPSSTPIEI